MADDIIWDDSDFEVKSTQKIQQVMQNSLKAVNAVAYQILLLSQAEVPIHIATGKPGGDLKRSGKVVEAKNLIVPEAVVGYNKVYASYQHEGVRADGSHVVKHYTNPTSKRKYLEDPIKHNLMVFRQYFNRILG